MLVNWFSLDISYTRRSNKFVNCKMDRYFMLMIHLINVRKCPVVLRLICHGWLSCYIYTMLPTWLNAALLNGMCNRIYVCMC